MNKISEYLKEYTTLTPSDAQVGAVATSDWWSDFKSQFDDLLWMYFADRVVFVNGKFNPDDSDTTKDNMIRTFAILLKSKKHQLDRMYEAMTADYNPLWNVDGVVGTIYTDTHTGTNTQNKTGTDTLATTGTDTTRFTGSDAVVQSGSNTNQLGGTDSHQNHITRDENTRTGNVVVGDGGTDINNHGVFTFDDQTNIKKEGIDSTEFGKTETTTYNTLKDAHLLDSNDSTTYGKTDTMRFGKTDTTNYGKVDATTYGKNDATTYNSQVQDTRNLSDEHIEMVFRQGNIGLTKSTELAESEWSLRSKYDFMYYLTHLCVNQVTYGVDSI